MATQSSTRNRPADSHQAVVEISSDEDDVLLHPYPTPSVWQRHTWDRAVARLRIGDDTILDISSFTMEELAETLSEWFNGATTDPVKSQALYQSAHLIIL